MHQSRTLVLCTLCAAVVCTSERSTYAAEPAPADDTRVNDLEQRMFRLESLLSQEGCDPGSDMWASCSSAGPSVFAGYKFLFVQPQMKESFEATLLNTAIGQTTLVPLDNKFELTPNVFGGVRFNETLGARLNYWEFDQDGNNRQFVSDGVILPGAVSTTVIYPATIIAPAPGDILTTGSTLNVRTIDAEGTIDVKLQQTEMTFGGGLRFASTDQHIFATATRGGAPIGLLQWTRDYRGMGPTVSGSATHPLFGGLSAVGNFRGTLLFGEKDLNRTVVGDVTPPVVANTPVIALNNSDEVVAAGDMSIGLRYSRDVTSRAQMFVQGTYEGQIWTDAGQPTMTFLGFQGLGLALGFSY